MSVFVQVMAFVAWMGPVPLMAGGIFAEKAEEMFGLNNQIERLLFFWCSGQIFLWAGFQLICVPMIIQKSSFIEVVYLFLCYSGAMDVLGTIRHVRAWKSRRILLATVEKRVVSKEERIFWAMFALLFAVQLVCAVFMAYEEGDDAFYVAVSTITNNADTMYQKMPYTGGSTEVDIRHGLAPMPIWISFLANVTGMIPVSVAQVAVPLVLLAMSYSLFYLIGSLLFGKVGVKRPLFMSIMALLVLFGGYSNYTVENFVIVRTAQGKSILGNITIPFFLFLFLTLLGRLEKNKKISANFWLLMLSTVFASCLCSTQGAMLVAILLFVMGVCSAVCYRRWKFLIPLGCCCIPAAVYLLLYVFLK